MCCWDTNKKTHKIPFKKHLMYLSFENNYKNRTEIRIDLKSKRFSNNFDFFFKLLLLPRWLKFNLRLHLKKLKLKIKKL